VITFRKGNLFASDAKALVNTVNCVGIMGKGIAHQFAKAYPEMAAEYVRLCRRGEMRLGHVAVHSAHDGRILINFPTKDHWKSRSRLEDIRNGLMSLRQQIIARRIPSIAVPPLGCGNGGLAWPDVRAAIEQNLSGTDLDSVRIDVYEPIGDFRARAAKPPKLSLSHCVLVDLRIHLEHPNKLTLQKAAYFTNVFLGVEYFRFAAHRFGPYSVAIDPMYEVIRSYIDYFGVSLDKIVSDGLTRALAGRDVDKFHAWEPTIHRVASFCNRHKGRIEALATVHEIVRANGPIHRSAIISAFWNWSAEKRERFTELSIDEAIELLLAEGLLDRGLMGYSTTSRWRKRTEGSGDEDPMRASID
jgi:O-acetyl-ADP-ribose deacetylase (regulator of RNase III)